MQTKKARARYLPGGRALIWEVTHPNTRVSVWSSLPRDAAAMLIERYVLQQQVEKLQGIDYARAAIARAAAA
ncbi:hypothetical protein QCE49_29095 [Caballeronia sp. LZ008]|uniref:hypothetical protein n=1 Tax=unclassified Caballeronia TaxID=2646786 RepID=UPI002028D456|nr:MULTISPECIES: hypothetical protein [unclassified Caballeronia]MDR5797460.1 hypothetical protein [Caballeronia sp. LZ008]